MMIENSFDIQNVHNNSFANYTHHNISHFAEPSYTSHPNNTSVDNRQGSLTANQGIP